MIYLEPPYDRGFSWTLVVNGERARISQDTAQDLIRFCKMEVNQGKRLIGKPDLSRLPMVLSVKARRMLLNACIGKKTSKNLEKRFDTGGDL